MQTSVIATGTPTTPPFSEVATLTFEGRDFTAGGAFLSETHVIGYVHEVAGKQPELRTFEGKHMGFGVKLSTWRTPRSFMSSTMSSFRFQVGGKIYAGRGAGNGMVWRGRIIKRKKLRD